MTNTLLLNYPTITIITNALLPYSIVQYVQTLSSIVYFNDINQSTLTNTLLNYPTITTLTLTNTLLPYSTIQYVQTLSSIVYFNYIHQSTLTNT